MLALVLALMSSWACGGPAKAPQLPPVVEATTIGVGDVFELHIVGEDDLPTEFTVAPDGSVDIPYIQRVQVAGLEPHEVRELVRKRLIEREVLLDPTVVVNVKAYNSKRVVVTGEVKTAGSLPLEPGMTLVRAISQAGGLTSLARKNSIILRRRIGDETRAVVIDYDAINNNEIPDVPLQAGDTIHVPQRVF